MKFSKKKISGFAAGALALALIAGSWAYYTSSASIDNNLHTKTYANKTIEEFTPDQDIEPGSEITKAVGVTNTGDYDLVVRIKMDESWSRKGAEIIKFASSAAGFNTVVNDDPTYTATQGSAVDGLLTDDQSVMYKNLDLTKWTNGDDGYWYFNEKLTPGSNTGNLLESLTMATNADMGKYNTVEYYSTAAKATVAAAQGAYDASAKTDADKAALEAAYAWTTTKPADTSKITYVKSDSSIDSTAQGYAGADYKLSITTEVCQATKDAVTASWTTGTVPTALMNKLS